MARALANECSTGGKSVAFFMKKGADCLSKWIGESERQLRLLFDQVVGEILLTGHPLKTLNKSYTNMINISYHYYSGASYFVLNSFQGAT